MACYCQQNMRIADDKTMYLRTSFLTSCYTILGLRYIILPIKNNFSVFFLTVRAFSFPIFYYTYKIMYKLTDLL